jgi:hypothetical protein
MPETNNQTPDPNTATPPADPAAQGASPQEPAGAGDPPSPAPAGDVLDTATKDGAEPSAAGDVLSGDDAAQREGVPDQYTFDPPEGFPKEEIDEERLSAFMDKAREVGLSQDQFQGIMSYYAERTQASMEEAVEAWNGRVQGWRDAARADKDFGGANYDANVATALKAVEKFGDADFKALLKSPSDDNPEGLAIGNHPAVLRFLNRIGKVLGDPTLVQGDATQQDRTDEARLKRMYPSMFKDSA